MPKQPCELCQGPDRLETRDVKRVDLQPMVEGRILATPMRVCRGCREAIDHAAPLVWVEGGFAFFKFADGAFANRYDAATGIDVLINLPDETTYRPGQSSFPSKIWSVTEMGL